MTEKLKCEYAGCFLEGIPFNNWDNYQRRIEAMTVPECSYKDFLEMHQDCLNPKHIRQFAMIIRTKRIAQRNAQSVTELIAYLITMERKMEPAPVEAERF